MAESDIAHFSDEESETEFPSKAASEGSSDSYSESELSDEDPESDPEYGYDALHSPILKTQDACVLCDTDKAKKCGRCLSISYCSKECQKKDWKLHKLVCHSFATLEPRPSTSHYLVMLFPVDEDRPKLLWLKDVHTFNVQPIYDAVGCDLFGTQGPHRRNMVRNHKLDYAFTLHFDDSFILKGLPINRSLVVAAKNAQVYFPQLLQGPVVATVGRSLHAPDNCTAHCLRQIVDWFQCYRPDILFQNPEHDTNRINVNFPKRELPRLQGAQISCCAEVKLGRSPHFVEADVPLNHPVYWEEDDGEVSTISAKLGLPVQVWVPKVNEYSVDPANWTDTKPAAQNFLATLLMLNADPTSKHWGFPPVKWLWPPGNALVIRKDRRPLLAEHLEIMARFIHEKVLPMMVKANEKRRAIMAEHACLPKDWVEAGDIMMKEPQPKPVEPTTHRLEVMDFITWDNMMAWKREDDRKKN